MLTELNNKPGKFQAAILKYCMGPESEEIMKAFYLPTEDAKDYKTVVEKLRPGTHGRLCRVILQYERVTL